MSLIVAMILAVAAVVVSAYLTAVSLKWIELAGCASGSCAKLVLSSRWAHWLGIPVGVLALLGYLAALGTAPFAWSRQLERRRAAWSVLLVLAAVFAMASFWFVGLMVFYMHKSCGHCLVMHALGITIAYLLINGAPIGREQGMLFLPGRAVRLLLLGVAIFGIVIGGQLTAEMAAYWSAKSTHEQENQAASTDASTEAGGHDHDDHDHGHDHSQPTGEDPAAAIASVTELNTPEGKAALLAQLKKDYGDRWDQPSSTCQWTSYVLSQAETKVTESRLGYQVIRDGDGRSPLPVDRVRVHYRGALWSGQVFHDTFATGQPEEVVVGQLIPGLAEALPMMREGSRWRLFMPPTLAFGMEGVGDVVPQQAHVTYEVELVRVLDAATPVQTSPGPSQEGTP